MHLTSQHTPSYSKPLNLALGGFGFPSNRKAHQEGRQSY